MQKLFLFMIIALLVTSIIGFAGCSRDGIVDDLVSRPDPDLILADMTITDVKILIAESRPAQVKVVVTGYLRNGCESHHETHQSREGNTINIQITTDKQSNDVCSMSIEYQEEILIGTFAIGEYKLVVNGIEQRFGIEDNGHWINQMSVIESSLKDSWIVEYMPIRDFEISISESRPAQVKVMVAGGSHRNTCVSVHEIHQTREGNTFNIQIKWRRERLGGGLICGQLVIEEVPAEVFLGALGVGAYKVIVNGIPQEFHID